MQHRFLTRNVSEFMKIVEARKPAEPKADKDAPKAAAEAKVLQAILDVLKDHGCTGALSDRDRKNGTILRVKSQDGKSTIDIQAIAGASFGGNIEVEISLVDGEMEFTVDSSSDREIKNMVGILVDSIMGSDHADAAAVVEMIKNEPGFGAPVQFLTPLGNTAKYWADAVVFDAGSYIICVRRHLINTSKKQHVVGSKLMKPTGDMVADVDTAWRALAKVCKEVIHVHRLKNDDARKIKMLAKRQGAVEITEPTTKAAPAPAADAPAPKTPMPGIGRLR